MTQTSDRPPLRLGGERALLVGLVVVVVVASLVGSLGAPLIPAIARESDVPLSLAQWTLTAAMLVGAVTTPLLGRLGDGRHRRRVVLCALSAVMLGCLLSAMTTNIAVLIAGRSLQGTGLGLVPLGLAIARDHLSPQRIRPAVSILSVTAVAGAGFGYPICGALSRWYGVQASFGFGTAIAAVALGVAFVVLPRGSHLIGRKLDVLGAALLASALTTLLLAVTRAPALGWSAPVVLGLAGTSVILGSLTVRHLLRVTDPLVELLTRHQLWAVFVTMALAGVGAGLTFAAMPGLIVAAVPAGEVGSATGFNQVLRSVGFATGSTAAAAVLAVYTSDRYPDPEAYDVSCAAGASLFAVTALVVAVLARRGSLPRADGRRAVQLDTLEP